MSKALILTVETDGGFGFADDFVLRVNGHEIFREATHSSRADDVDAEIWAAKKLEQILTTPFTDPK